MKNLDDRSGDAIAGSAVPAASEGALDLIDRSRECLVTVGEFFAASDQVCHRSRSQLHPFTEGGQRETAFLGAEECERFAGRAMRPRADRVGGFAEGRENALDHCVECRADDDPLGRRMFPAAGPLVDQGLAVDPWGRSFGSR
jgi:hypothetical protein